MCVFTCVSTCVGMHSQVCMETKGRHWVSCSSTFHIFLPLGHNLAELEAPWFSWPGCSGNSWDLPLCTSSTGVIVTHRQAVLFILFCFLFTLLQDSNLDPHAYAASSLTFWAISPSQGICSILKIKPDVRGSRLVHQLLNCLVDTRMDINLGWNKIIHEKS